MEGKKDKEPEIEDSLDEEVAEGEPSKQADEEDESAELKDRLVRLMAEFDNYKKRVAKEIDGSKGTGRAEVISKLLPVLDEFELAIGTFDKNDEQSKGITLIYANFMAVMKGFGLKVIESDGISDPYKHEVVMSRESEHEEGKIIEVVRKGYELNGVMLRPASVIVSNGTKAVEEETKK